MTQTKTLCTCGHDENEHKKNYGCYNINKDEYCPCQKFTPQNHSSEKNTIKLREFNQ